jgi:hypothetical protein
MAWGSSISVYRHSYTDLARLFATARNKSAGKPLDHSTRIFERSNDVLTIRHHSTDILRYHPDGSIEVNTGWTSNTTLERIRGYAGISVYTKRLPAINGFRPGIERTHVIRCKKTQKEYVFNSRSGYIRFDAEGRIDPSTVDAIHVDAIADAKAVRVARKQAGLLLKHIQVRVKLGVPLKNIYPSYAANWLSANLGRPIDTVDFSEAPANLNVDQGPIWYAKEVGATETVEILEVA